MSHASLTFTPAIAAAICERLAAGESLRAICRDDHIPPESTVRGWVVDNVQGFAAQYARARDIGLDCVADEIREIADTPVIGETETSKEWGTEVKRGDMIEHRKLQVDARKWYLSKLAPKRYGDTQKLELTGADGGPVLVDSSKRASRLAALMAAAQQRAGSAGSVADLV